VVRFPVLDAKEFPSFYYSRQSDIYEQEKQKTYSHNTIKNTPNIYLQFQKN